ncbi:YihY family inner membrane protein [bacterium]|nr:YihY family inner membrane protein [bacterium]
MLKSLEKIKEYFSGEDDGSGKPALICALVTLFKFIRMTVREFVNDRLFLRAMALTFVTLLSLIPLLAILFSMFNLFGGGEWFMETLRPELMRNLAPGSEPIVAQRIEELLVTRVGTTVGGIGILFLLFAVYGIFAGIESTFNLIWGANSRIGMLRRLPQYWGILTIIPILVVSSLAFTTYIRALPLVHQAVERVGFAENLINRMLPVMMVIVGFFLLYRFLPSARVRTSAAIIGAVVAGLIYECVKIGFIFYTGKLVQYNILYGSLAIIPLLMIWVNLSWIVVLFGVEVCYVYQHYNVLLHERKHALFSRLQKDALAYRILTQVTLAFRGKRDDVTLDEWSSKYAVPPGNVLAVVERLKRGGILERIGIDGNSILLKRDPDYINVDEIDRILSGEALEEWVWPNDVGWDYLRKWMSDRFVPGEREDGVKTLDDLVNWIEKQELPPQSGDGE